MRRTDRTLRLTVQIAVLVALASLSAFLLARTYLGNPEKNYKSGSVTELVAKGPVTLEHVRWQVDSVQPYTQVVDEDGRRVGLENNVPGSVVIAVRVTVTALDGIKLSGGGYLCEAALRDNRGNVWKNQDQSTSLGQSSCSDDERPTKIDQPTKIVKLFVVPASAVPHLAGLEVAANDELRRVLITF